MMCLESCGLVLQRCVRKLCFAVTSQAVEYNFINAYVVLSQSVCGCSQRPLRVRPVCESMEALVGSSNTDIFGHVVASRRAPPSPVGPRMPCHLS